MKGIRLRGAPMYLDMQATTPLDPRVLDAMLPFLADQVRRAIASTALSSALPSAACVCASARVCVNARERLRVSMGRESGNDCCLSLLFGRSPIVPPPILNSHTTRTPSPPQPHCRRPRSTATRTRARTCTAGRARAPSSARAQVAALIGADPKEIVFTSGATESNNLAIKGVAGFYRDKKRHIVTTQTEHKCVLDSCRQLQEEGFDVTYLPVQKDGLVDLDQLRDAIREGIRGKHL